MNKKLVGVIIAGVTISIGAIVLTNMLMRTPVQPAASTADSESTAQAEGTPEPTNAQAAPGVYTDYSASAVATTSGTKILFFHAPWCPQCRELDKSITTGAIPPDVTIFKVDYDSNQVLRQKYSVTIQTTLVKIDDAGALIKKYVAYNKPNLQALIENLL